MIDQVTGDLWSLIHGDSVEVLPDIPNASIDLIAYSPPFYDLFVYSGTDRDLGNSKSPDEFMEHFGYITRELYRVLKPGRVMAVHVMDIPATLVKDGYIGLKDFSGDVIRHIIGQGFTFDARVAQDANQQAQSIRTHAKGLTKSQLMRDQSWLRPALPNYILKFRKPGENAVPIVGGDVDMDTWIDWANPTWPEHSDRALEGGHYGPWYGIRETQTLSVLRARDNDDGRHLCALQLPTLERIIRLWSNKGEIVLDPFVGIGSSCYVARQWGRRSIGIELKDLWWREAVKNLRWADQQAEPKHDLYAMLGESAG